MEISNVNCIELIIFLGHKKDLIDDLAVWFKSDHEKAKEFIDKYFKFPISDCFVEEKKTEQN